MLNIKYKYTRLAGLFATILEFKYCFSNDYVFLRKCKTQNFSNYSVDNV